MEETSIKAYKEILPKVGERQLEILRVLSPGEATDSEITTYLGKEDPNYVRPRRFELVNELKFVGFSRKRKCRITGKTCNVWKLTSKGREFLNEM